MKEKLLSPLTKSIIVFMCIVFFIYYQQPENPTYFVEKYGKENFNDFSGHRIYFRGKDADGNYLVPVDEINKDSCGTYYIVRLGEIDKKVVSVTSLDRIICIREDTTLVKSLAERFMEYDLKFLYAPTESKIYIGTESFEYPNLLFLGKGSYLNEKQKQRWVKIAEHDQWYREKRNRFYDYFVYPFRR